MSELKIYYNIVPTNDGYTYLCQDKNTSELYLWNKASDRNPEALVFSSKKAAKEWIELTRLSSGRFEPEWFATVDVIEKFADIK